MDILEGGGFYKYAESLEPLLKGSNQVALIGLGKVGRSFYVNLNLELLLQVADFVVTCVPFSLGMTWLMDQYLAEAFHDLKVLSDILLMRKVLVLTI